MFVCQRRRLQRARKCNVRVLREPVHDNRRRQVQLRLVRHRVRRSQAGLFAREVRRVRFKQRLRRIRILLQRHVRRGVRLGRPKLRRLRQGLSEHCADMSLWNVRRLRVRQRMPNVGESDCELLRRVLLQRIDVWQQRPKLRRVRQCLSGHQQAPVLQRHVRQVRDRRRLRGACAAVPERHVRRMRVERGLPRKCRDLLQRNVRRLAVRRRQELRPLRRGVRASKAHLPPLDCTLAMRRVRI